MVCTISEGERWGDDISSNVIQEVENTAVGANDDDDVCVLPKQFDFKKKNHAALTLLHSAAGR